MPKSVLGPQPARCKHRGVPKRARHRWRVEGIHGEAKTQHGLRRAARRGLWTVSIQVYLTAAVMNLKRLAVAWLAPLMPAWYDAEHAMYGRFIRDAVCAMQTIRQAA